MDSRNRVINADHQFSSPNLFNDLTGETKEHMNTTLLFGEALSYATSNNNKSRTTQNKCVRPFNFGRKKQLIKKQTLEGSKTKHIGPIKIRSSTEIEEEIMTQIPKFQARPLNRKILESKGELGLLCNRKRQVTIPKEFHFAIDERIPPRRKPNGAELFDKIALSLESNNKKLIPRKTTPRPFHFHTEERGQRRSIRFLKVKGFVDL